MIDFSVLFRGSTRTLISPSLSSKRLTEPEVFILESLTLEDEQHGRLDGKLLADVLRLYGKKPIYYYFRTQTELIRFADMYWESGYRYLHLSCHGDRYSLSTTFQDIEYGRFAEIFGGKLDNRRLFVSGCELGNQTFANAAFSGSTTIYSVIAPSRKIGFNRSVAFWTAFYFVMFDFDSSNMKRSTLSKHLSELSRLFDVSLSYFWNDTKKKALSEQHYNGWKKPDDVQRPEVGDRQ
jgi:hypothetical protein